MEIEQLKLILETLNSMGVAGQSAFIWWLALDKVLPIIAWLIAFSGLGFLVVQIMSQIQCNERLKELRNELGVGSPGYVTTREAAETLRKAIEVVLEHKASKSAR